MWLFTKRKLAEAKVRLFCFPNAGGGASVYRGWSEELAPDIELSCIQLPGRESRFREKPCLHWAEMIGYLSAALTAPSDRPFALFGHSFGSLLAFETAHAIRSQTGREPSCLFISAARAPDLPLPHSPISGLREEEFVSRLVELYEGIPPAILADREFLEAVLPTLRADIHLLESFEYRERTPLNCPVVVFGGLTDRALPLSSLDGWRKQTTGPVQFHFLDAGHFYLQSEMKTLVRHIRAALMSSETPLASQVVSF